MYMEAKQTRMGSYRGEHSQTQNFDNSGGEHSQTQNFDNSRGEHSQVVDDFDNGTTKTTTTNETNNILPKILGFTALILIIRGLLK